MSTDSHEIKIETYVVRRLLWPFKCSICLSSGHEQDSEPER